MTIPVMKKGIVIHQTTAPQKDRDSSSRIVASRL